MKTYELKIEPCHTGNEKIYRTKGHHSAGDFLKALKEYGVQLTTTLLIKLFVGHILVLMSGSMVRFTMKIDYVMVFLVGVCFGAILQYWS